MSNESADSSDALLKRLLAQEPAAWRELVETHSGMLLAVSRRTFKAYGAQATAQDHEDVAAAVWGNLLENDLRVVKQCAGKGTLAATLVVMTKHRAVDVIRKKGVRGEAAGDVETAQREEEPSEEAVTGEALNEAMGQLPERQRVLLRLFYLHQKPYKEIHKLTGVPENSIGPTIARGLQRLRELLGGAGGR